MNRLKPTGKFAEEPTRPESERLFFLDDVDRGSDRPAAGQAPQARVRARVGLSLEDPPAVPWPEP